MPRGWPDPDIDDEGYDGAKVVVYIAAVVGGTAFSGTIMVLLYAWAR